MNREQHQKVTPQHLKRAALLYVRQSTMRQVFENTESTKRQYALRDRAAALGWPRDDIVVIDGDLGHTATAAGDREGFERVVTEVGMGRVGIVLGLEVSRLARNSSDWHRLLEICALAETLILDEDGIYNPKEFNDRLLLGLKGQMSEAEIYVMKARLHGGILSKALRGELQVPLPTGLVYDTQNRVQLDPDKQVQESITFLFTTFDRTGSATLSSTCTPRPTEGWIDLGTPPSSARVAGRAQPAVCGSFRVGTTQGPQAAQWPHRRKIRRTGRVDQSRPRRTRGLHYLEAVPSQPATTAG
jgi:DNA invertase Pin-like site-specific DNA recombinase